MRLDYYDILILSVMIIIFSDSDHSVVLKEISVPLWEHGRWAYNLHHFGNPFLAVTVVPDHDFVGFPQVKCCSNVAFQVQPGFEDSVWSRIQVLVHTQCVTLVSIHQNTSELPKLVQMHPTSQ